MELTDIVGKYLRGYMPVEDVVIEADYEDETSVYLYFDGFTARMFFTRYDSLLHSTDWDFEVVDDAPDRDSRYKAIGECVQDVIVGEREEEGAEEPTDFTKIKTLTKVLDFTFSCFDGCYEDSIWDVI